MNSVVKRIVQKYVNGLSSEQIQELKVRSDALQEIVPKTDTLIAPEPSAKTDTIYTNQINKYRFEDYPVLKENYVHRSILIVQGAVNVTNPMHRQAMCFFHPWMKGYIEKVGKALWSTPPIFAKPSTEKDQEPEEDEKIKQFWEDNRLQEALKKSWEKSIMHGIIFYYPMDPKGFFDGYSGPSWYIYSVDEMGIPFHYTQGHPDKWKIHHTNMYRDKPDEIAINQGVFYDYKNTDDFTGEPFGLGIWDLLIDWIWIDDAVNAFDQRMGNGFMTMVVPNNTTDEEITKYEDVLKRTRTEKGIVIRGAVDEPVELNWVGMSGMQVDFISHLEKIEDLIAFNMGFPKRWIMGDPEGAMESSGKDALQVNIQLKNLFMEWVIYIKRLLKFHNLITDFKDIVIKPPFELQLSEQEQLELDLMKTQTIAAKTWMTVNEQREADGLEPIEGGDTLFESNAGADAPGGDINQDSTSMMSSSVQPGAKRFQTSTKAKADTFETLIDIFTDNQISVRQLAELCGVSPTTISKIRDKFDTENQPKAHVDELTYKCDAVNIQDEIYEIQDVPVVLPQKKFYEKWGYEAIRPREEIERIFNDPKYPKEFRIGVTPSDDHASRVPREILSENAVGTVRFTRLDEEGNIRANIRYDLKDADRILGKENFIREKTTQNENINTSVALYSRDRPSEEGYIESDLDIRSFVFTQNNARNKKAGL